MTEIELTEIEAEFLVVGFAGIFPMLIKTNRRCSAIIQEDFAVAGEGAYLAQASLLDRGHWDLRSFDETLYAIYEAKKFAEGAPTVGKSTSIWVLHRSGEQDSISTDGLMFLEGKRQELGRKKISGIDLKPEHLDRLPPYGQ
jgi:hypothetical protein